MYVRSENLRTLNDDDAQCLKIRKKSNLGKISRFQISIYFTSFYLYLYILLEKNSSNSISEFRALC